MLKPIKLKHDKKKVDIGIHKRERGVITFYSFVVLLFGKTHFGSDY